MQTVKTFLTWKYLFIPAIFFVLFLVIAVGKGVSKGGGSEEGGPKEGFSKLVGIGGKKRRGAYHAPS